MCAVFSGVQTVVGLPVLGIFNVPTDVGASLHATARGGCADTARVAPEADTGRKIPYHTRESNLFQCSEDGWKTVGKGSSFHYIRFVI